MLINDNYFPDINIMLLVKFSSYQESLNIADKIFYLKLLGYSGVGIDSRKLDENNLDWYIPIFKTTNFELK